MADVASPTASTGGPSAAPTVAQSPSDVLRLVVATVLLLGLLFVQRLWGDTLVTFTGDLLQGLGALPTWLVNVLVVGTRIFAVMVLVGGLILAVRDGGGRMLATSALAAAIAAALVILLEQFDPSSGQTSIDAAGAGFPSAVGLGAITAALTAAAPWLSRRARRLSWTLVVGLALTHFLVTPASFDTLRAALCGWLAGAAALVALGGPLRCPSTQTVTEGLASVGVHLADLEPASVDARGSTPYFGVTEDGQKLFVKALGEDQRSADLLFRLYRKLGRRDLGDERPFSSLRRTVEHEAMVALVARDAGILTPHLVAFATAEPNGFVLAYESVGGRSLDRVEPDDVTDEVLAGVWAEIVELRRHRIAHRDLRLANIFLAADAKVWMIDFGFSELAASDLLLANDLAELIASSTLKVGPERAMAQARAALSPPELRSALERMRPWALSGATRTGLKAAPGLLDDIRSRVTAAAD